MRRGIFLFITMGLIALGGAPACVERKLTVDSEPEGSLAFLNNQEVGRTPVTRQFTWYGDYDVVLRREGYNTLKTNKNVIAPWWQWPPIDLVAEVLPIWFKDEQHISFVLQPTPESEGYAGDLLERANEMRGQLHSSEFTRQPASQR
jgi:hypothetical protein